MSVSNPQSFDWDQVDSWMQRWGDSLYLVRLDQFESNCRQLLGAVREIYPRTQLGYSYKTNYTPAICRRATQIGCYAEVVSRMELDLALQLGVPGHRILFNGPVKSVDDLRLAVEHGVTIHVDDLLEIDRLRQLSHGARGRGMEFRVGVRCNFPLASGHHSRFGLDAERGDVRRAVESLRQIEGCRVAGLHCHFSHFRDPPSYGRRVTRMIELARECFPEHPPEYIDVGGGFSGAMPAELAAQFPNPLPTSADYATEIGTPMRAAFGDSGPELILEPGMGVVADCVEFAVRVTGTKSIGSRHYVVTTGSIYNIKPLMSRMNLPLRVLRRVPGDPPPATSVSDVVGFTCMEIDVMYRGLEENVAPGDILVFGNVGAYTTVLLPPFIRPAPAMMGLDGDQIELLRRPQSLADLLATYADADIPPKPETHSKRACKSED